MAERKINSRSKGASGEREFCSFLLKNFGIDCSRNLDQVREGGADIILPLHGIAFEIKRVESPDLESFWLQAKEECQGLEPIVAYRKNKSKWSFLISPEHVGCKLGFVELKEITFVEWFKRRLANAN